MVVVVGGTVVVVGGGGGGAVVVVVGGAVVVSRCNVWISRVAEIGFVSDASACWPSPVSVIPDVAMTMARHPVSSVGTSSCRRMRRGLYETVTNIAIPCREALRRKATER